MNKKIFAALVLSLASTSSVMAAAINVSDFTSAQKVVNMGDVEAPAKAFSYSGITFISNHPEDGRWRNLTYYNNSFTDDVGVSDITMDFATAATKVGLDLYIGPASYAVSFFDTAFQLLGTVEVNTASNYDAAFAGWESQAGISRLRILELTGDNGLVGGFNDIRTEGNVSAVPEPASIALLGLGMAALGAGRRRKAKAQ